MQGVQEEEKQPVPTLQVHRVQSGRMWGSPRIKESPERDAEREVKKALTDRRTATRVPSPPTEAKPSGGDGAGPSGGGATTGRPRPPPIRISSDDASVSLSAAAAAAETKTETGPASTRTAVPSVHQRLSMNEMAGLGFTIRLRTHALLLSLGCRRY